MVESIKKAQAALEFLTTYGWAFLVIIIMMSALAYFGVLNPSKLLPDRCNFGAEIGCNKNAMVVTSDINKTLNMRLTNSFGVGVVVTSANVKTDVETAGTCTAKINDDKMANLTEINAYQWESDSTIDFVGSCDKGDKLIGKEKIKFNIEVNYYPSSAGTNYRKTIFGEVFATIQPKQT